MTKWQTEILIFQGQECTCNYGGRVAPERHAADCAWRLLCEFEREMDYEAQKETADD